MCNGRHYDRSAATYLVDHLAPAVTRPIESYCYHPQFMSLKPLTTQRSEPTHSPRAVIANHFIEST
ncbi:hypothetical protein BT63DRAFT_423633 [Microthyrium microscopicum]|uniref:Uncharacterized protein n=1 Tax=Microthyrium microscopicum TaxID=703497 RepID=A0A6A6UGP1_9PEZI|nr:hypothetical protein BT63DRAFT_423633 [Microthyrium microscopicum]